MRKPTLAILALLGALQAHAATPEQVATYVVDWLVRHGYPAPRVEFVETLPADAVTARLPNGELVVRFKPSAITEPKAQRRLPNGLRLWQNLALHEACHYVDFLRRGTSDHEEPWRVLARRWGVAIDR